MQAIITKKRVLKNTSHKETEKARSTILQVHGKKQNSMDK